MLVFALALAMIVTLLSATAITLHSESQNVRVKATARRTRFMQ
ncbi:hypothetical protein VSX64_05570 [Aurantimonas sp. C2-6-R+9]|uniref:Uncharacterized protein n=1 Tax=marine sediment metagenome TaxID=412755 RepID=A0A0F9XYY1_9ZZZZ|nr:MULTISPECIES: hypothetical protein [unclassified Aurantimonas]MEC5290244.1 hypothetical protein [Aurantimonas sp. C2-3-R2]MEC5321694.1 hypothetical protein [Aurantimonas sp. A3-2-R12]MEC5380355.1 hypothetical protein [Aurantimonas sp. C2-6-R+9]MEC5411308.1 hypothetical protein [Aurantimonas sp. C2-4-R8]